jgi:ATP-binding cassette subfamily F protein 3
MITFRNLALRRGEHLLLSGIDLSLHAGCRVGVIGRNGCGKTSLFAAIQGELEADQGDIDLSGRIRIASVAQETPSLPDPAIDFVISGDTEVWAAICAESAAMAAEDYEAVAKAHQRLEEVHGYDAAARAGRLLHGLGFPASTHLKPAGTAERGPGADDPVRPAVARRAHQPPRSGRRAVAGAVAAEISRHTADDFPRS